MKKIIVLTLLMALCFTPLVYSATNWSKFESGRNNIRLDGYDGQPGYIAFTDGSGTVTGYLWMGLDGATQVLRYCSADAIDLTTTKLSDVVGVIVGTGY